MATLEVVHGESRDRLTAARLADVIKGEVHDGTLYLGYPVLATSDSRVQVDALLISPSRGLVAFQIADSLPSTEEPWEVFVDEQDQLFTVLEAQLARHDGLRRGRRLAVTVNTVTVFPSDPGVPSGPVDGVYCSLDALPAAMKDFLPLDPSLFRSLQAALQRVTNIKPQKRRQSAVSPHSRGSVLKSIEQGIANLDRWQKQAAIESPEGPQRIRGLAGSGKTIVLALKAAYLHAQHPEWRISLTFQSRALYQQLEDLILRFSFEHSNDRPDATKLRLQHAWGGSGRDGMYREMAIAAGVAPRTWTSARATWGYEDAFRGCCRELLDAIEALSDPPEPIYDAVLIDEAQDLPAEFFRLVYRFTKQPKRIIWGYDELQKLNEAAMSPTSELFGTDDQGDPLVQVINSPGEPRRDIILPVCYRNTAWALATAHALGFGIYRAGGLVQHFDEPMLWGEIGYSVEHGSLSPGVNVDLKRASTSTPDYFGRLLRADDAVVTRAFDSELAQDTWVASEIAKNLQQDELETDDILVVIPESLTSKSRAYSITRALAGKGIKAHLVGVSSAVDEVFRTDSVAIAHIYRAKGNEAPMVYALDCQHAAGRASMVTRRNTLFTAITRSRAWVRIVGWGEDAKLIAQEVERVAGAQYHLRFPVPTEVELAQLRRLHRDRSQAEIARVDHANRSLAEILELVRGDQVQVDDLTPALVRQLRSLIDPADGDL